MFRKLVPIVLVFALLFSAALSVPLSASVSHVVSTGSLTPQESQFVALVNGTEAYNYDLQLEKIALNHGVSNYAFRAGGSEGATAAVMWISDQFVGFGLNVSMESFDFTNWNLLSQPALTIDEDGNPSTVNDQISISSFQSEHYSWPTVETGVFADLVVLPLPDAANFNEVLTNQDPIGSTLWSTIDTQGKIVLVGREVRWNNGWDAAFRSKLGTETPVGVVYTWWYPWMSFCPPFFSSVGGRPPTSSGPYFWNLRIPSGWVNYEDGLSIRSMETSMNVSARATINSVIGSGPHYNVVGELKGNGNSSKVIIVSGHYDTVMTSGFVDNGAGTAGVVELARVFAEASRTGLYRANYTVRFIGFASEELGLIGASNYVWQHKAEMKDIVAVINLDSIGGDNLNVATTDPSGVFNLAPFVLKAANDLGVAATTTQPGGSDQEVFRDPLEGERIYSSWWPGLTLGISDAPAVHSSTMLVSSPLLYSDQWNKGKPGWIHTAYDNSTSTQTLNWLKPDNFKEHIEVAALSAMRLSPSSQQPVNGTPFPWWTWALGVAAVAAIVVIAVVYFIKVRKPVKDVVR